MPADRHNELRLKISERLKTSIEKLWLYGVNGAQRNIYDRPPSQRVKREIFTAKLRVNGGSDEAKGLVDNGSFGLQGSCGEDNV